MRQRKRWKRHTTSNAWFFRFSEQPDHEYCQTFERPVDEQEVRRWARQHFKLKRLPSSFRCTPITYT